MQEVYVILYLIIGACDSFKIGGYLKIYFILGFIAGILSIILQPIVNFFSRRHERQADRISYELTNDVESMVRALVKLSKENLSNLYPHPLYVALYYSHPPILDRIRCIKNLP